MTDIEQAIMILLEPYEFVNIKPPKSSGRWFLNGYKSLYIIEDHVALCRWTDARWEELVFDLCDPNSLTLIEDWAKKSQPPRTNRILRPKRVLTSHCIL